MGSDLIAIRDFMISRVFPRSLVSTVTYGVKIFVYEDNKRLRAFPPTRDIMELDVLFK